MDNELINHESITSTARLKICIGHLIYQPMSSRIKAMLAMRLFSGIQAPLLRTYTNPINKFNLISPIKIDLITLK